MPIRISWKSWCRICKFEEVQDRGDRESECAVYIVGESEERMRRIDQLLHPTTIEFEELIF